MSSWPLSLEGMLTWAANMASRPDVGYSQTYRSYQTYNGITYFDCSSFVFFAMWLGGGLDVGGLGYDTNLAHYQSIPRTAFCPALSYDIRIFNTIGCERVSLDSSQWHPGDFIIKTRTHIEMVYSVNPLQAVGARSSGYPLVDQVAIHSFDPSYYDMVYRYHGDVPPTPPDPGYRPHGYLPLWLIKRAIINHRGGI